MIEENTEIQFLILGIVVLCFLILYKILLTDPFDELFKNATGFIG
jgi:hypothetical protein